MKREEINQCTHCKRIFATKKNLKVHIMNIHEKIRHFCDQCGSSYSVKQNLLNHIHEKHEDPTQKPKTTFPCKECGKGLSRPYNLCKNHQFQDKTQLLTCDRCGFSTKRAQQLHMHQVCTFVMNNQIYKKNQNSHWNITDEFTVSPNKSAHKTVLLQPLQ